MSLSRVQELADELRDIPAHAASADKFTAAMWAAYRDALPALALAIALSRDDPTRQLVDELAALPLGHRAPRARVMAKDVPGRYGRRAVIELLLRAAEGKPYWGSVSVACYTDAPPGADQAKKKPKGTLEVATHDIFRSAAECAVETVCRLAGAPADVQPPKSAEAHGQQLRLHLQEVAAYVLRHNERDGGKRPAPPSPSRRRRKVPSIG